MFHHFPLTYTNAAKVTVSNGSSPSQLGHFQVHDLHQPFDHSTRRTSMRPLFSYTWLSTHTARPNRPSTPACLARRPVHVAQPPHSLPGPLDPDFGCSCGEPMPARCAAKGLPSGAFARTMSTLVPLDHVRTHLTTEKNLVCC